MNFDQTRLPRAYSIAMDPSHTWTLTADAPLWSCTIEADATHPINVKLNGDNLAFFQVAAGTSWSFNSRDVDVKTITLTRPPSASGTAVIQVFASCLGTSPTAVLV